MGTGVLTACQTRVRSQRLETEAGARCLARARAREGQSGAVAMRPATRPHHHDDREGVGTRRQASGLRYVSSRTSLRR